MNFNFRSRNGLLIFDFNSKVLLNGSGKAQLLYKNQVFGGLMEGRDSINFPCVLYPSSHRFFLVHLVTILGSRWNSCGIFLEIRFLNPVTFPCVLLLPKERGLHALSLLRRILLKASFGDPNTLNDWVNFYDPIRNSAFYFCWGYFVPLESVPGCRSSQR